MKVAIASDAHGSASALRAFLAEADKLGADKIVLLGDLYYHGARNPLPRDYAPLECASLLNGIKHRLIAVRGNCDSDVDLTVSDFDLVSEAILCLGGKAIHLSHGDRYDEEHLPKGKYDLVLYGHYHVGFIREKGGVIVANPGSISLPKGDSEPSFLLLEEGKLSLRSLAGALLAERVL